jgi:hypothetical protein
MQMLQMDSSAAAHPPPGGAIIPPYTAGPPRDHNTSTIQGRSRSCLHTVQDITTYLVMTAACPADNVRVLAHGHATNAFASDAAWFSRLYGVDTIRSRHCIAPDSDHSATGLGQHSRVVRGSSSPSVFVLFHPYRIVHTWSVIHVLPSAPLTE